MGDGPVVWAEPGAGSTHPPLSDQERGVKRVDARKVGRGSIHLTRSGLPWGDAPGLADGPHKTLYNRCRPCSDKGVFDLIFSEVSASDAIKPSDTPEPEGLMLDATALKAHPTPSSRSRGGLNPA